MIRFRVILVAVVTFAYLPPAESAGLRKLSEVTCTKVRAGVSVLGVDAAIEWARKQGYTSVQIMQAKKCLKGVS